MSSAVVKRFERCLEDQIKDEQEEEQEESRGVS